VQNKASSNCSVTRERLSSNEKGIGMQTDFPDTTRAAFVLRVFLIPSFCPDAYTEGRDL
jgi:hypothetical protein